jgi:hypothetical protein
MLYRWLIQTHLDPDVPMKPTSSIVHSLTSVMAASLFYHSSVIAARSEQKTAVEESTSHIDATNLDAQSEETIPQSVFVPRSSSGVGKDPFFPNLADRSSAKNGDNKNASKIPTANLTLQGISGSAASRLAVISGRTFAVGEVGDIPQAGGLVSVRCLEITEDSVTIEVGGERQELRFPPDTGEMHKPAKSN